jgi:hypothetical protein
VIPKPALVTAAILVAAVLVFAVEVHAQTTSVVSSDYYPLAVGDSWTYQATVSGLGNPINGEMTMEVTGTRIVAGTNCYVVQATFLEVVTEQCLAWQEQQLVLYQKIANGTDLQLSPPQIVLQLPLSVGQHWTWSGTELNSITLETTTNSIICDVTQQSTITVSAGTYQAYAVTYQVTSEPTFDTPSGTGTQKMWFVEGIGEVKEDDTLSIGGDVLTISAEMTQYNLVTPPNYLTYLGSVLAVAAIIALGVFLLRRLPKATPQMPGETERKGLEEGIRLRQKTPIFCIKCGAELPPASEFCNKCGTKQS